MHEGLSCLSHRSRTRYCFSRKNLVDYFGETHELRCFTIFALQQLLENNHFELVNTIDFDKKNKSKLKTPDRETFRKMAVARLQ